MAKRQKKPKAINTPQGNTKHVPQKQERVLVGNDDSNMIVRFNKTDRDGPWCLSKIKPSHHLSLLECIASVETSTIHEAFNGGHPGKDYTLADLPSKEAAKRLRELELDDRDQISRIRVGGEQRLYGFRQGRYFYALWWDPKHEIWPSNR